MSRATITMKQGKAGMDTIIVHPTGMLGAIADRPFKLALALFAVYSGIAGLSRFGSSSEIFDDALRCADLHNCIFILAGLLTIIGVLINKTNWEASGLFLISVSLFLRILVTIMTVGWTSSAHNILAIGVIFIVASLVRIGVIFHLNKLAKSIESQ
jgi:hypothetical protein